MDFDVVPAPVEEITPRVHAAVRAGFGDLAPATLTIPNERYTDPAIAAAELRTSFSAPMLVTPTGALKEPGDYLTVDLLGTPTLVVEDEDGRARVFVNACRHRGAQVVEGSGCARRFTCPYHNWVYDADGSLVGLPGREGFDDRDLSTLGLVELPSEERHGFLWALRDPAGTLDLDAHLGPFGAELGRWGYDYDVAAVMELELACNWKCALEAFQETYHFPYVHGSSMVGQGTISNIVTFDQFGRHHRIGVPLLTMGDGPEPPPGENAVCIYYVHPCTVIASSPFGGELLQFFPGATPSRSTVRHLVLSRWPVSDPEVASFFERYTPQIQAVVRDEDAPVLERSGIGLAAGHTDAVIGRNEIGCQAAHRQIESDIAATSGVGVPVAQPVVRLEDALVGS